MAESFFNFIFVTHITTGWGYVRVEKHSTHCLTTRSLLVQHGARDAVGRMPAPVSASPGCVTAWHLRPEWHVAQDCGTGRPSGVRPVTLAAASVRLRAGPRLAKLVAVFSPAYSSK